MTDRHETHKPKSNLILTLQVLPVCDITKSHSFANVRKKSEDNKITDKIFSSDHTKIESGARYLST